MDLFSQLAAITKPAPAASFMPVKTQPEEIQTPAPAAPARRIFTNIPDIITEIRKIGHADKMNYSQFLALYADITEQKTQILGMINKMTMPEINKFVFKRSSTDTKKDMVKDFWESIIGSFNLGGLISYTMSFFTSVAVAPGEPTSYEEALNLKVQQQTENDFNIYQEGKAADRAKRKKALENPETLEEFRIYLQYKKLETLSTDQRANYDLLITDGIQQRRERDQIHKAEVKEISVKGLQMEIKTSHHAKKNIPLWVVVMGDRVESDVFNELKEKAKKFNGYYSSYRGQGAIPGFTFESAEEANLFCELKEGNVNAAEIVAANEQERILERAEALEDKAARIEDIANESLSRERKANTHKRAREAASAENKALAQLEFSQIMAKIAEGQKNGTIKYLNRLQNISELSTLFGLLSSAKYRYIRENKISYRDEQRQEINASTTPEIFNYVVFPYPAVWKENVYSDLGKLIKLPGCKLAAARMIKRLNAFKGEGMYYFTHRQEIEDFELLFTQKRKGGIYTDHYKETFLQYKRVMRLQIESLPELRTALRELVAIAKQTELSPELLKAQQIREMERKFINADIPGFFPTPATLAQEVVNLARIAPGNTVLEPSAGLGHLAEVIAEMHPENYLLCVEYNRSLYEALCLKGFSANNTDFLQHPEGDKYDRIIMNPPFENGRDIDHVLHAYNCLNEGGRLVAIMAGNKSKSDKKTSAFMELVECKGYYQQNPAGSFLSSFRPTGVNTITVVLDKK